MDAIEKNMVSLSLTALSPAFHHGAALDKVYRRAIFRFLLGPFLKEVC